MRKFLFYVTEFILAIAAVASLICGVGLCESTDKFAPLLVGAAGFLVLFGLCILLDVLEDNKYDK